MNPYEATARAAENGINRASQGASAWHDFMECVIRDTARRLAFLTSDDVREEIAIYFPRKVPFNLMALGAKMQKAQRDGILVKTGKTRKSRTRSQHRDRDVFASRIFYPGARMTGAGIQPPLVGLDAEP